MDTSLIISKTRVEIRRKRAGLQRERDVVGWIERFFTEMSINHSSQIRPWQQEAFLSRLKNEPGFTREDHLQARSALLFMNRAVLSRSRSAFEATELDTEPGVFRITA
jgi:hypothetical protein